MNLYHFTNAYALYSLNAGLTLAHTQMSQLCIIFYNLCILYTPWSIFCTITHTYALYSLLRLSLAHKTLITPLISKLFLFANYFSQVSLCQCSIKETPMNTNGTILYLITCFLCHIYPYIYILHLSLILH